MDLPFVEMSKTGGGGGLRRKIKDLVLGILSLRCLLNIQVETANRVGYMSLEFRGSVQAGELGNC